MFIIKLLLSLEAHTLPGNDSSNDQRLGPRGGDLDITCWKLLCPGGDVPRYVHGFRSKIRSNLHRNIVTGYLPGLYPNFKRNGSRIT